MAKCPMCGRKAKRKCKLVETSIICSACCGISRQKETCNTCVYYQEPKRNYKKLPAYTTAEMDHSENLQGIAKPIEVAICTYDYDNDFKLKDDTIIRMIELALDKLYFKDAEPQETDRVILEGYERIITAIQKQLSDTANDILVKILGIIHFVAKRRTQGNREYLKFINQYVGADIGPGLLRTFEGIYDE